MRVHNVPMLWYDAAGRLSQEGGLMPRKTSETGKPTDAAGTELKSVRVELTPSVHRALRIEAAKQDLSMAAYVRGLIEDHLAKRKS
jgi:predicted HicB family RNase H-like nuclease